MYVFVFASLTTVSRVRFYIKNKLGINFDTDRVSSSPLVPGCSWGLFVPESKKDTVLMIIKELNVNLLGVYEEKELSGGGRNGIS